MVIQLILKIKQTEISLDNKIMLIKGVAKSGNMENVNYVKVFFSHFFVFLILNI